MCEGEREGKKERERWQSDRADREKERGRSILFGQRFDQNDVFSAK